MAGRSSHQASHPRCHHEEGSFLFQLNQPQRQLADGAVCLVCLLGAFGDLGGWQGSISSTWGAGFGQNGYLGDWAQTCSKDKAPGGSPSLIVMREPGRLALPWARWAGRIREHASMCGTSGKSNVIPSTGMCGHPTICQAHMGVQPFSCLAQSWSGARGASAPPRLSFLPEHVFSTSLERLSLLCPPPELTMTHLLGHS